MSKISVLLSVGSFFVYLLIPGSFVFGCCFAFVTLFPVCAVGPQSGGSGGSRVPDGPAGVCQESAELAD